MSFSEPVFLRSFCPRVEQSILRRLRLRSICRLASGDDRTWSHHADPRVWLLFVLYGACFGIEITVDNVAALYFKDHFKLSLGLAGFLAGLTGMMSIFARALGGYLGDRWGRRGFICVSTRATAGL